MTKTWTKTRKTKRKTWLTNSNTIVTSPVWNKSEAEKKLLQLAEQFLGKGKVTETPIENAMAVEKPDDELLFVELFGEEEDEHTWYVFLHILLPTPGANFKYRVTVEAETFDVYMWGEPVADFEDARGCLLAWATENLQNTQKFHRHAARYVYRLLEPTVTE